MLWSNGLVTESLHPGEMALSALGNRDVEAIARRAQEPADDFKTSRPAIRVTEAKAINLFAA